MNTMRWRGRRLNLARMRKAALPKSCELRLGPWWEWDSDEATRRGEALMARVRGAYPTARTVQFDVVERIDRLDSALRWRVR
jgi:hypothetical protein